MEIAIEPDYSSDQDCGPKAHDDVEPVHRMCSTQLCELMGNSLHLSLDARRGTYLAPSAQLWMSCVMSDQQRNVFGEPVEICSLSPMAGFFRSGCCHTGPEDVGLHTVCVEVTSEFLAFSKARGNDLSTPLPDFGFPGLKPGDRWCLCAARWQEALEANAAPRVVLSATHEKTLEVVELADLKRYALDLA